ncbi:hypothetical protein JYU34_008248, partial [Plutella xylostella]
MASNNPYKHLLKSVEINGKSYDYYDIAALGPKYARLPYSIRVLLESCVRNCDNFQVREQDVTNVLDWEQKQHDEAGVEIAFKPARVILQDLTGVPAVVDLAAMRHAVHLLGGDPDRINPTCPADLVIDHSVQVDHARDPDALNKNQELEFIRNKERFQFLKWGAKAFDNMTIVPPGSGIVHQVNLEYLARVVFSDKQLLFPDSLVGTDSHTTMLNGLGVVAWGVGGIEAEAVMLGQAISMLLPQVVGFKLTGELSQLATSTDLVLTITKQLRSLGVVGKFVEFFGPGARQLSIADRATVANMCPEFGATVAFFPIDETSLQYLVQTTRQLSIADRATVANMCPEFGATVAFFPIDETSLQYLVQTTRQLSIADRATVANMCLEFGATVAFFPIDETSLQYLVQTNRSAEKIALIEKYLRLTKQFRNYDDELEDPVFSQVVELDLSTVVTSVSGPKRPQDRVSVVDMKQDFESCLTNKVGFKGYGLTPAQLSASGSFSFSDGREYTLGHGSVVIAAITSCTNTSNPSVMLGAGLLAKKAVEAGLRVAPYIKTSLSPGSGVVTYYLRESGVTPYLEQLGFNIVGYGCMTCIGNSGPIDDNIANTIEKNELVCCGILSGNRNFEGRIHPHTRANYLASPLLVIAYALAGTVRIDLATQPLGTRPDGSKVFLADIWPTRKEIQEVERRHVIPRMFKEV